MTNKRMSASRLLLTASFVSCALASAVPTGALGQWIGNLRVQSLPEVTGSPVNVSKSLLQREKEAIASGQGREVSVIVRLVDDSLAAYKGTIPGLAATNPRAIGAARLNPRSLAGQQYLKYLEARQQVFSSQLRGALPNARVTHQFQVAFNGLAVVVPESRISALAGLPGVAAIYEDVLLQRHTETSPAFIGAPTLWNQLGGQGSAGEGVIVGVLDTGIWPEHPSLADPDPFGKPYAAPPPPSGPARACQFSGGANPGAPFACNNKLIGAQRFLSTYDAVIGLLPGEYTSARDDDGHGTHTASTAAGNGDVAAAIYGRLFGKVSGIAPRAHVIMYKVCGNQGCYSSDSVAAVNRAILDGVDVINFSISGGSNPYSDAVSLAFLDAYDAGVFVAASAGNSGPGADTTDHREPWTTTVAASTSNRQFESVLTLNAAGGSSLQLRGASVTPGLASPFPVVVPNSAPVNDPLCLDAFPTGSVAGKVVVCQRGGNARVAKSFNVAQGGAVGMILYNPTLQGLATDNHFIPSVHLENTAGAALNAFLAANTGVTASMTAGSAVPAQGDVMAPFSSRGGPAQALGVSKPDVTAPGVQILAGNTPTPATQEGGFPGQLFQAIQGTSMSSPHVAGAAALVKALRPNWTPGQIRSALMTTASGTVYKEDGVTPATPFDHGSGRIDLTKAGNPGLLFDESAANYVAMQSRLWDANYPSLYVPGFLGRITVARTVQNTRNADRDWKLVVSAPSDLKITVPSTITVPASGSATFNIDLDGRNIPVGQVRHALIQLQRSNETTLRFPITVVRGASVVPLVKNCAPLEIAQNSNTNCTITITNTTFNDASVLLTDVLPSNQLRLVSGSVVNATESGNGLTFSGVLGAAQPPNIGIGPGTSPAGGYLPLSLFGIGPIGGVGDETITNFNVPAFVYGGETYTRLGVVSNGYLVVGGGSGADVQFVNQSLPSPSAPNNVLAPFWTDLNPAFGGAIRIGTLTDGVSTWIVVDWAAVREYSQNRTASFQAWIRVGATEDITFAYGTIQGNGDGGLLTVGAENRFGNRGANYYYNGTGTLPSSTTQLGVTSTPGAPGEARTITFSATGRTRGSWTNCAEMISNAYFGTQTACVSGTTVK